jgi:hypothetical protein
MSGQGDLITSSGKKSSISMRIYLPLDGKGIHCEHSTLLAYDGDSIPERYDQKDPRFQVFGEMEITSAQPIEKMPTIPSASCDVRVFDYDLEVDIVGGAVEITAVSAGPDDEVAVVGKVTLPKLETV